MCKVCDGASVAFAAGIVVGRREPSGTLPVCGELLILAEDRAVAETCASVGER
jgi:hypothetical protein